MEALNTYKPLTPQQLIDILVEAGKKYPREDQYAERVIYIRELRKEAQKK